MRTILAFCFFLFGYANLYSQVAPNNPVTSDTNAVFTIVKQNAKFPGDVNKFLSDSISYPDDAKDSNKQGTVYVQFVVEKDGSVSNIKILRGVFPSLDKESVRVISIMPKWTPAMQNGHTVRQQYLIPIHFILRNTPLPPPKLQQPILQNPFK